MICQRIRLVIDLQFDIVDQQATGISELDECISFSRGRYDFSMNIIRT